MESRIDKIHKYLLQQLDELEKEFIEKIHSHNLETLRTKYREFIDNIYTLKNKIELSIYAYLGGIKSKVVEEILKYVDSISFEELIEYAMSMGILVDVFTRLPGEKIFRNLQTLRLKKLYDLFSNIPITGYSVIIYVNERALSLNDLREEIFRMFLSRLKTDSCKDIEEAVDLRFNFGSLYERLDYILDYLYERIDCSKILGEVFEAFVRRDKHSYLIIEKYFERIINNAIENFNKFACSNHIELFEKLDTIFWNIYDYIPNYFENVRTKILENLRSYAIKIIENLEKCSCHEVEDLLYSDKISTLHGYLRLEEEEEIFVRNVTQVIVKYLEEMNPYKLSEAIDTISVEYGSTIPCLVLEKGLAKVLRKLETTIQKIQNSELELNNLSMVTTFSSILKDCDGKLLTEIENKIVDLCSSLKPIVKSMIDKIVDFRNSTEFIQNYYWLLKIKTEFIDEWCKFTISIPEVDFEKITDAIRKDLAEGFNPYEMRNLIRNLQEVDLEFANKLEKRFNRIRLKLGIKFKERRKKRRKSWEYSR